MNAGLVWSISNLVTGLICIGLVFVILKHSTKKIHYFLVLFNIAVAIWGFGAFFIGLARNPIEAALAWKIACIGGLSSPMIFYHMINILSGNASRKTVIMFYIYGILINVLLWTKMFDLEVIRIYDSLYYMYSHNFLWKIFFSIWIAIIIYSLLQLYKLFKLSSDFEKIQYRYLMIGFTLGFSAAIWDALPTVGLYVYPASNIFMSFYSILITYAIIRHKLLDIDVAIKKTLIFVAIFAVVYAVIMFFTLFLQSGFEKFFAVHKVSVLSTSHTGSWPSVILFGLKINVFSIPPLVISFFSLGLGVFVYLKNKKSNLNITNSLVCLCTFIWLFSYSVMYSCTDNKTALFFGKIGSAGVLFIPISIYHFTILFTGAKKRPYVIVAYYMIGAVFLALLFFTNIYVSGTYYFFWGYYPRASSTYFLFVVMFVLLYCSSLLLLNSYFKLIKENVDKKNRAKYVLLAFFIAFFASVDFLPKYGINFYPFGYVFIFIWLAVTAYAILRHKLLEIEVIIRKTLIFGGLFTIVYTVFAFFALLGQAFFERLVTHNRWISMIPSVLVVTIMLRPLENFLTAVTDRYLFQKKYDYKDLLRTFTSEVLTVLELDKLIELTKSKLSEIMKIESCEVVLEKIGQSPHTLNGAEGSGTVPIFSNMLELPIIIKGKTTGALVLGKKKSDEGYTQEDLSILQPLTKALGIAISNAKLFEELSKTRAEAVQKEKMATIGTLAAGMAHEIRNPITTIRNFADYLPERYDDKNFMDKFDKLIPREIDRVESIARSLLEFSSVENAVKDEEFPLYEPVKTVISLLEPQYRTSEIKIICDFSKRHIVKGNKVQLQDIIFNIVNYVMAETPKGGSIVIECATDEKGLKLYIRSKDLVVADHIIKDVFEPVSGMYREKRGFGFNIFVAKQLIEKSGGRLTISTDKSAGSEFCINI